MHLSCSFVLCFWFYVKDKFSSVCGFPCIYRLLLTRSRLTCLVRSVLYLTISLCCVAAEEGNAFSAQYWYYLQLFTTYVKKCSIVMHRGLTQGWLDPACPFLWSQSWGHLLGIQCLPTVWLSWTPVWPLASTGPTTEKIIPGLHILIASVPS